ncbi:hypothetical protein A5N72_10050 [Prescottella equi]|nr:hypothetical protein A5N72_10050 [Prescottella equi]
MTETVGDGPAGHAHRQHAVSEDTRVPAIARVHVVAVQRMEVAGRTRVHDDLRPRQILDQHDGPCASDREILCGRAVFDDRYWPGGRANGRGGGGRRVRFALDHGGDPARGRDEFTIAIAVVGEGLAERHRPGAASALLPGGAGPRCGGQDVTGTDGATEREVLLHVESGLLRAVTRSRPEPRGSRPRAAHVGGIEVVGSHQERRRCDERARAGGRQTPDVLEGGIEIADRARELHEVRTVHDKPEHATCFQRVQRVQRVQGEGRSALRMNAPDNVTHLRPRPRPATR